MRHDQTPPDSDQITGSEPVINAIGRSSLALRTLLLDDTLQSIVTECVSCIGARVDGYSSLIVVQGSEVMSVYATSEEICSAISSKFRVGTDLNQMAPVGICGRVALSGDPLRVGVVTDNVDYIPFSTAIKSQLTVPIQVNRGTIGVLSVALTVPDAFTASDEHALGVFANLAATAIARDRLHRVAIEVSQRDEKSELLNALLKEAAYFLQVSQGGFYEYHQEKGELVLEAQIGQPGALGNRLKVGEGVAGHLVHTGDKYLIVPNYSTWEKRSSQYPKGRKHDAVLGVLLRRRDESIIGCFSLDCEVSRGWTEAEAKILSSFADHFEIAYEKLDLIDRLKSIRDTAKRMAQATALGEYQSNVNERIVQLFKESLKCDLVFMHIFEPDSEKLNYPPTSTPLRNEESIGQHSQNEPSAFVYQCARGQCCISAPAAKLDILPKHPDLFLIEEGVEAFIAAPLRTVRHEIGVVFVCYYTPRRFALHEQDSIELLAAQTAVMLEYAQNYQETQHFLSSASHELRDPIELVQSTLELLAKQTLGELNEQQQAVVEQALAKVRYQEELVMQLLDLRRLDAGSLELDIKRVSIVGMVKEIIESLTTSAQHASVSIQTIVRSPGEVLDACVDEMRMRQTCANILRNAVKFGKRGGRITVTIERVAGNIAIEVRDDGGGIPAKDIPHIFERYYQGTEKRESGSGLGLGLYLARIWMKKHCGDITVHSSGNEATFYVRVPVNQKTSEDE